MAAAQSAMLLKPFSTGVLNRFKAATPFLIVPAQQRRVFWSWLLDESDSETKQPEVAVAPVAADRTETKLKIVYGKESDGAWTVDYKVDGVDFVVDGKVFNVEADVRAVVKIGISKVD